MMTFIRRSKSSSAEKDFDMPDQDHHGADDNFLPPLEIIIGQQNITIWRIKIIIWRMMISNSASGL
jgi:hypothetical protein